jgi:hypothetical protein
VEGRLTPELRSAILVIKASVHEHPEYRRRFGAKDVYDAVLKSNVRTLRDFSDYLRDVAGVYLNA